MSRPLFLVFALLFVLTQCQSADPVIYFRLSTIGPTTLKVGEMLVSTLGNFRATLQRTSCVLLVQQFNGTQYQFYENVTGASKKDCSNLSVRLSDSNLMSDNSNTYLSLSKNTCNLTQFSLDDNGMFRLICSQGNIRFTPSLFGFQARLTTTKNTSYPYFYTTSNFNVTNQTLLPIKNKGGWQIQIKTAGQLTLSDSTNSNRFVIYSYPKFTVRPAKLMDPDGNMPPEAFFADLNYFPRCGYMDFHFYKSPYIFEFDDYWPLFRVRDHTGYTLLTVRYPHSDCYTDFGLYYDVEWKCSTWVCPPQLFQHQGSCVQSCPAPFFHSIKRNESSCLLNCQQGATRDNTTRVCACGSIPNITCPQNSTAYPLGCKCATGFYDGLGCVSACAPGNLGLDGVCLSCPFRCKSCQVEDAAVKYSFLKCLVCDDGYTLKNDLCIKDCNQLVGKTPYNGQCFTCQDPNCLVCNAPEQCTQCSPLYALLPNFTCSLQCGSLVSGHVEGHGFSCLPPVQDCIDTDSYNLTTFIVCLTCPSDQFTLGNKCVSNCTQESADYVADTKTRACKCTNNRYMINKVCLSIAYCPAKMYLNSSLGACRSCPYGCLSCFGSICTSCAPGFILAAYVVPVCVYDSPYYQCLVNYHLEDNFKCVPNFPTASDKSCYTAVPDCFLCNANTTLCIICKNGTYMFVQTCVATCPAGTFPYNGVCLANNPEDANCQVQGVGSVSTFTNIGTSLGLDSPFYEYYSQLNNFLLPDNNPIVSIQRGLGGVDPYSRITYFRQGTYFCKKCNTGFATGRDGKCVPCPVSCAACYTPDPNWCQVCASLYRFDNNTRRCIPDDTIPFCKPNQYLNASRKCVTKCPGFYLPTGYNQINCTDSCPPGYTPILANSTSNNNGSHKYQCIDDKGGPSSYLRMEAAAYKKADGTMLAYLAPYQRLKLTNTTNSVNSIVYKFGSEYKTAKRLLQNTSSQGLSLNQSFVFFNLSMLDPLLVVNFTSNLGTVVSESGALPANLVYGILVGQSRPEYMKTDFAFIGYVTSICLLLLLFIYVGNDLMYKVDNTILLAQTVFYFLFIKSILELNLSQFYYGWSFSHFWFFPSFFSSSIPDSYHEDAGLGFKLTVQDGNIIRNAGFNYSLIIVFFVVLICVILFLAVIRFCCRKLQPWQPQIFKNATLCFLELMFVNMTFFSVTQLKYGQLLPVVQEWFLNRSRILAIFTLVYLIVYTIIRLYFNKIGGLYCIKRLLIGFILGATTNNSILPLLLIAVQVVFAFVRFVIEQPIKLSQNVYLIVEELLIMILYLVLNLSTIPIANIIIVSAIIGILLAFLCYDLIRLYTEAQGEWDYDQDLEQKNMKQIAGTERLQN